MPRLRSGYAYVTDAKGGGFRRIPDHAWSHEMVDNEDAYPGIRHSGTRFIDGHLMNVWKVGDEYFAQSEHYGRENPLTELLLVGGLGLAAIGAGVYFAMKASSAGNANKTYNGVTLLSAVQALPAAIRCSKSTVQGSLVLNGWPAGSYTDADLTAAMTAAGCTAIS